MCFPNNDIADIMIVKIEYSPKKQHGCIHGNLSNGHSSKPNSISNSFYRCQTHCIRFNSSSEILFVLAEGFIFLIKPCRAVSIRQISPRDSSIFNSS
jgi:hypothetical protein